MQRLNHAHFPPMSHLLRFGLRVFKDDVEFFYSARWGDSKTGPELVGAPPTVARFYFAHEDQRDGALPHTLDASWCAQLVILAGENTRKLWIDAGAFVGEEHNETTTLRFHGLDVVLSYGRRPWTLCIPLENKSLEFRMSLRRLAHAAVAYNDFKKRKREFTTHAQELVKRRRLLDDDDVKLAREYRDVTPEAEKMLLDAFEKEATPE